MSDKRVFIEEMSLNAAALKYPALLMFPQEMFADKNYIVRLMFDKVTGKEVFEIGYTDDAEWCIPAE